MATTALVVEILIVGLELEAVLALLVFAVFDWTWIDFGALSAWVTPLTAAAFAAAYVLGIVGDRFADSATDPLRRRIDTPESVPKMRLAVLAANAEVARFLDYQRSRMRVARGTAFAAALAVPVSAVTLAHRQSNTTATIVVPAALAALALLSAYAFRRIDEAYVKRLRQAFHLTGGSDAAT